LRLGFVSADLRQHPVGQFLVRTIEALRGDSGPIACYSNSLQSDELTARIRAAADVWREVPGMSDETLAEQIRADGVDILFDLSGHTAGNRLLVFARKPAPIQITWIGYPGTTGLSAMDYILADESQIPAAAEADYRERVLRLPEGYVSYDPPADAPSVSPLPAAERGWATLASFSSPAKISPPVIEVWAEILRRLPQSRLTWIFRGLDCPSVIHRYAGLFAAQGIDPARVDLRGWLPHGELLAQYGQVDLALDPFPYSGGLTTCEALWMGVPVITWPGETFAGRHAVSHLCSVGLTETIAHDRQQYVELAVGLAGDPARLAALRGGLRQRMAASPLCDGPRLAGNLMALLRGVWRQWAKPGKDHENTKARRKE
jgi:predicted O-linked N-acetylglucosamine transferase (SPINDLY family)